MGWNDSRAILLAPGWGLTSEVGGNKAKTINGEPIRILRVKRLSHVQSIHINPDTVRTWFEGRGFSVIQASKYGDRLQWQDVEASIGVEEGELAEVTMTFTLTRDSPMRWPVWKAMVEQFCKSWDMQLYRADTVVVAHSSDILNVLADTPSWKEFAENYSWPPIA